MVTRERDDAPRRILHKGVSTRSHCRVARARALPVRVELEQDAQADGQLSGEEAECLTARDVAARERSRACSL